MSVHQNEFKITLNNHTGLANTAPIKSTLLNCYPLYCFHKWNNGQYTYVKITKKSSSPPLSLYLVDALTTSITALSLLRQDNTFLLHSFMLFKLCQVCTVIRREQPILYWFEVWALDWATPEHSSFCPLFLCSFACMLQVIVLLENACSPKS